MAIAMAVHLWYNNYAIRFMLELKEESIPSLDEANVQEIPTIEITPDTEGQEIDAAGQEQDEGDTVWHLVIDFSRRKLLNSKDSEKLLIQPWLCPFLFIPINKL